MKKYSLCVWLFFSCFLLGCANQRTLVEKSAKPLRVGFSTSITKVTPEAVRYARSVGVSCIEIGLGELVDKNLTAFNVSDEKFLEWIKKAKSASDEAGIKIWSIHMPFGKHIDLSLNKEEDRKGVVAFHKKVLGFIKILNPEIILFHPSWHLGLNVRELRKSQLIKSATELNDVVRSMKATMVIENMLGPELLVSPKLERPLCRTVEETVEIMNRLPKTIYSAIDMNHIKNPENLILAMGDRLKSLHVADGDGLAERHYFPCSGEGQNNWTAILAALDKVNYKGPFMFESKYPDVKNLKECYEQLYANYKEAQPH